MKYGFVVGMLLISAAMSAESKREIFTGEIADSSCAYNVHSLSRSHKEMLKSKAWGKDAADCTRRCVKQFGSSYVLVHKNDVFKLDQQPMAEKFAGQQVKIDGTFDESTQTIHIEEITSAK